MLTAFIEYKVNFYSIHLVEHIGFEPMTSSMPWKRASQLRQCPVRVSILDTRVFYHDILVFWLRYPRNNVKE